MVVAPWFKAETVHQRGLKSDDTSDRQVSSTDEPIGYIYPVTLIEKLPLYRETMPVALTEIHHSS